MYVQTARFRQPLLVWFFRCTIFVAVISVVISIVYYTPFPDDKTFPDCNRPCHELDWPMICRFKLHVQHYEDFRLCQNQTSCTSDEVCNAQETCHNMQDVYLINEKLLGPTIQVCKNDILVIDIINRVPGRSLAFHWHGQHTRETPSMDGVAMVTQCPVLSHTVYQYKLRAAQAGTHYYHALTGDKILDRALQGGLIVRESGRQEMHSHLYDQDIVNHTVHLTQRGDELYVNGNHGETKFLVSPNMRYRFRLIHGGVCSLVLSIASHPLLLIAVDGNPISPELTDRVELVPGERMDFVVTADRLSGSYELNLKSSAKDCALKPVAKVQLVYNSTGDLKQSEIKANAIEESPKAGKVSLISTLQRVSKPDVVTIDQLRSADPEEESLDQQPDIVLTLEYYNNDFNNVSFLFPPSPLVTQLDQVDPLTFCDSTDTDRSEPRPCTQAKLCHCTHVIRLPLRSVVQVTLLDKGNRRNHVFHLHGHRFHLVNQWRLGELTNSIEDSRTGHDDLASTSEENRNDVTGYARSQSKTIEDTGRDELNRIQSSRSDSTNKIEKSRSLFTKSDEEIRNKVFSGQVTSVSKDTIGVDRGHGITLRFRATNPGFWSLHSQHNLQHQVLFQVGETSDLPPTPKNFPTCGSYVGPDFFLV